jgi:hypothetical protein
MQARKIIQNKYIILSSQLSALAPQLLASSHSRRYLNSSILSAFN